MIHTISLTSPRVAAFYRSIDNVLWEIFVIQLSVAPVVMQVDPSWFDAYKHCTPYPAQLEPFCVSIWRSRSGEFQYGVTKAKSPTPHPNCPEGETPNPDLSRHLGLEPCTGTASSPGLRFGPQTWVHYWSETFLHQPLYAVSLPSSVRAWVSLR